MQSVGLIVLALLAVWVTVRLAIAGRREGIDQRTLQVSISLAIGVIAALSALIVHIDVVPDAWELALIVAGGALIVAVVWRIEHRS